MEPVGTPCLQSALKPDGTTLAALCWWSLKHPNRGENPPSGPVFALPRSDRAPWARASPAGDASERVPQRQHGTLMQPRPSWLVTSGHFLCFTAGLAMHNRC